MKHIKQWSSTIVIIMVSFFVTACGCEHVEVIDPAIPATCLESGLTEGSHCDLCGEVFVAQESVAAKGHTEKTKARKEATCTENGLTEGKYCSVCGEVFVAQESIAAKGHTENTKAGKEATCTENGLTEGKTCTVCGEILVEQKTISATGHKWSEATCDSAKKCNVCGKIEGQALGHNPNANMTCSRCGGEMYVDHYAYIVANDFRRIRAKYNAAEAMAGYILMYEDNNGDLYAFTYVHYKITKQYGESTLHNLTKGEFIVSPSDYYNELADRAFGANKMNYWNLALSMIEYEQEALQGIKEKLSTGTATGRGVFVDAATLNL